MPTVGSVARSASLLRILQAAACRGWAVKDADCAMLAGFVTLGEQQHAALAGLSWTVRLQARHACVPYDFLGLKDSQRLVWIVALSFGVASRYVITGALWATCLCVHALLWVAASGMKGNSSCKQLGALAHAASCSTMSGTDMHHGFSCKQLVMILESVFS